jgi:flagellar biosynthesis GTPase FlhF
MKNSFTKSKYLVAALACMACIGVHAQELKRGVIKAEEIAKGAGFELQIFLESSGSNYCGFTVDWGDGQKQDVRFGDDNYRANPVVLNHVYANAGNFSINAQGRFLARGLKSAGACNGQIPTMPIVVVDLEARRQQAALAAEMERQRLEAERQRIEAERLKAAEIERQKAAEAERIRAQKEVEERQRQLAQKELELQRKELAAKEELLRKEEEIRKRAAASAQRPAASNQQQSAPAPAVVQPAAPANTPARTVKPADAF